MANRRAASANWNGAVPNSVSAVARFGGGTTTITTNPVITIDGPFTSDIQIQKPDNGRYMHLGEINALLGFTVTSEFLSGLGFVATQEKNARLYRECDFPLICRAIVEHIATVASVPTAMRRAAA